MPQLNVQTVSGFSQENNRTWWNVNFGENGNADLAVVNDSVYQRWNVNGTGGVSLSFVPSPSEGDTVIIVGKFKYSGAPDTVKAYLLGHPLTVVAGTFDSVVVYDSKLLPMSDTRVVTYFRAGVGVLRTDGYEGTDRRYSSQLVYYRIIRS